MTRPLFSITRAAAAACLLAAPARVFAQPPVDPIDQAQVKFGPIGINPNLQILNIGMDNNVFNDETDPKQDFTFTLVPQAQVLFRARRLHASYTTATEYVYFRTYSSERGINESSSARVEFDAGRLRPYVAASGTSTRQRLNNEVDVRARHHDVNYSTGLSLRLASRTNLLLNARRTTERFDSGTVFRDVPLDQSFNSRIDIFDGGLAFELTPLTTFSVLVSSERQRFELSPDRNSDTFRVMPTVAFSPLGLLHGTASVGYRRFRGKSPQLPDFSGLVATGAIGASIRGRHQVQAGFSRDVRYSYEPGTPYYLGTGVNASWTTQVTGPLDARVTGGRDRLDYTASGSHGLDTTVTYGVGAGIRVRQRARIGINADWIQRTSDRSTGRNYRNHRVFGTLTWGTLQ